MTKYILHGGALKKNNKDNVLFLREIVSDLPDPVSILIVCHMMDDKDWNEVLEDDRRKFKAAIPDRELNLILADEDKDTFIEQVKKADVVFMHGGRTRIIRDFLKEIPNIESLWKGKTVAGTSAGALALTKYWYENDDDTYNIGLGILPFKLFCHYTDEKSDKLEELKTFKENIEVRTLADCKFFVIEQEAGQR